VLAGLVDCEVASNPGLTSMKMGDDTNVSMIPSVRPSLITFMFVKTEAASILKNALMNILPSCIEGSTNPTYLLIEFVLNIQSIH